MRERYLIARDSVLAGCLVTPEVYEGILERFEHFVAPFIEHLHKRVQRQKAIDYMKGLMSDTERKNVESIAYFNGYDRQRLQFFIGQVEWDDEIILDKLVKRVVREIGTKNANQNVTACSRPHLVSQKGNSKRRCSAAMVRTAWQSGKLSSGHLSRLRRCGRICLGGSTIVLAERMDG